MTYRIGIVGCGNISGIYFQAGKTFPILDIVACADLDTERAKKRLDQNGIEFVGKQLLKKHLPK